MYTICTQNQKKRKQDSATLYSVLVTNLLSKIFNSGIHYFQNKKGTIISTSSDHKIKSNCKCELFFQMFTNRSSNDFLFSFHYYFVLALFLLYSVWHLRRIHSYIFSIWRSTYTFDVFHNYRNCKATFFEIVNRNINLKLSL